MRSVLLVHLAMLVGCGRLEFEVTSDSRTIDVSVDAAFATGTFGTPTPQAELNSVEFEDDVSLTADLLEIFFMSDRDGTERIYTASRATAADTFSAPVLVAEIDAGGSVNNPRVHPDGLSMVFASGRPPTLGGNDIFEATRPDRSSPWSIRHITELGTSGDDYEPCMSEDRLAIYFNRTTAMGDIHVATRARASDPFGPANIVSEVSSLQYDGGPWIADHGRVLLLHSRPTASIDIVQATRADVGAPFGAPMPLADINSSADDQDPWLSPDGHTIAFVSTRTGTSDIYIATR